MRNPNFARAQNSGPPLHKILDPPLASLFSQYVTVESSLGTSKFSTQYSARRLS